MQTPEEYLKKLELEKGRHDYKIDKVDDLFLCDHFAVLQESPVRHRFETLGPPPPIRLTSRKLQTQYGFAGNFVTMKMDLLAADAMQAYFTHELTRRLDFKDYEVSDVGFWDLDVTTDTGFSWHNDRNWNGYLRPDNRTYHGWFVYSRTDDCNSTVAVSSEHRYNECNTNVILGITDIRNDDVIRPDVIAPLTPNTLLLFPVGAVHRTHRFKEPAALVGHRVCVSFILHHRDDKLNEAKLATLTDDEICGVFTRYPVEKAFETGHYMIRLLEEHPRISRLLGRMRVEEPG